MPVRTYLRVRRRRNAQTSSTLCLEGLDGEGRRKRSLDSNEDEDVAIALTELSLSAAQAAEDKQTTTSTTTTGSAPRRRRFKKNRLAYWRRINSNSEESSDLTAVANKPNDVCRVVDAVLDSGDEDDNAVAIRAVKKRRRLTLVDSSSSAAGGGGTENIFAPQDQQRTNNEKNENKAAPYKVLNPLERLVDDSLRGTHSGEIPIAQHVRFVTEDPRLASRSRWALVWRNAESGNLLHACALWNDVETAGELMTRNLEGLTEATDGEGRTPYEVAKLSGHASVCQVLEAFGADATTTSDDDYVIDIYRLDHDYETDDDDDEGEGGADGSAPASTISCELEGGLGYWDDRGELVLEIPPGASPSRGIESDGDDEDVDSNHEDWEGNDYPDEECYSDDDDAPDSTFRHYEVDTLPSY